MGGKSKQSQRTKNNVRPSSSGRSALILDNVTFDSLKQNVGSDVAPLFPTLVAPIIDPGLSSELQLCFKKLNKKDPITKSKALQELCELVSSSDVEDIVAALGTWAHFYKILTADPDRKVREGTQKCHGLVVDACGRRIAPHLRRLVPAWLTALHDHHAPAAAHATHSLASTFPDAKLPEVLAFSKEDIVSHLTEGLTGRNEAAYVTKSTEPEEAAACLSRLVCGCLGALQYLAQRLPTAHSQWLLDALAPLLEHPLYWKRPATPDTAVRAAWYSAVGALVARFGEQFGERYGQRTLRVMLAAKESSPLAAAPLWDSLLLFMYHVPDWHQYLDKKELLYKRIFDLLENGGWGEGRRLCGVLLPLLARLPPDLLTQTFLHSFFTKMIQGLFHKSVLSSKSERQSWITSLDECLRYISIQDHDYIVEVASVVHRDWTECVLAHDGPAKTNIIKHSAERMATLVRYWLKQADQTCGKNDQLIRNFWLNIGAVLTSQVDKSSAEADSVREMINGHILMLQTLKTSFLQSPKKQNTIKFNDEPVTEMESPKEVLPSEAVINRYNHNLNDVVHKLCAHYFEFASKVELSEPVFSTILTLLKEFDSESLFLCVASQFRCDSIYGLYDRVLRGWLAGDTMRSKPLVDVVFMVVEHLTENEQDALFDSFKQFPPSVVEWCISEACARAQSARWLRADLVSTTVTALAHRLTHTGLPADMDLLDKCLRQDEYGECAVSASAAHSVICVLCAAVSSVHSPAISACVSLLCSLARTATHTHAGLITHALFAFTLNVQPSEEGVSPELYESARSSCGAASRRVSRDHRTELLEEAATTARALLLASEPTSIERMQQICSACAPILSAATHIDISDAAHFTTALLKTTNEFKTIEKCALRHDIVLSNFNCPIENDLVSSVLDFGRDFSVEDFQSYAQVCKFLAVYLRTVLLGVEGGEQMLSNEQMMSEFCRLVYHRAVVEAIGDAYEFWPHYNLIDETKTIIEEALQNIIAECRDNTRQHAAHALTRHAAARGYYWAYARKHFEDIVEKATDKLAKENSAKDDENGQETVGVTDESGHKTEEMDESDQKTKETDEETDEIGQKLKETDEETDEIGHKLKENDELKGQSGQEIEESGEGKDETEQKTKESELVEEKVEAKVTTETQKEQSDKSGQKQSKLIDEKVLSPESNQSEVDEIPHTIKGQCVKVDESEKNTAQSVKMDESKATDDIDVNMIDDIVALDGYFHVLQANVHAAPLPSRLRARYLAMLRCLYLRHADAASRRVLADAARGHAADADVIVNAYYNDNDVMLYDGDISSSPWAAVSLNTSVCEYLSALVASNGWALPAHQWDFTTITLCSLLTALEKSKQHADCTKVTALVVSVAGLLVSVGQFVRGLPAECTRRQPADHVAHLITEWRDIFAPDISHNLCSMMLYTLENHSKCPSSNQISIIRALTQCCPVMEWQLLTPAHKTLYPLSRFMDACLHVLEAPAHYAYKFFAYDVLVMMQKPLVLDDAERLSRWSEQCPEKPSLSLARCGPALTRFRDAVQPAAQHIRVFGDTCVLEEGCELARMALGWLLLYQAVTRHVALARDDLAHHYTQLVRDGNWCSEVLVCALKLLPGEVLSLSGDTGAPPARLTALFTEPPSHRIYRGSGSGVVGGAACGGVRACVCGPGAHDTRGWRNAAPRAHAATLDHLVTTFISPHVIKEEFTALQLKAPKIPDTKVTIRWPTNEVIVVLTLEDRPIELRITVSKTHPLTPPAVTAADDGPVTNTHWLLVYITYQNGSLVNAVRMWCASVSDKVDRAGACLVCYCRMHAATGRLPQTTCRQCRNKFHTICLRKWIKTSTKSSCPVCRSPL